MPGLNHLIHILDFIFFREICTLNYQMWSAAGEGQQNGGETMVLIKLPYKERKVVSEVSKIYCNIASHNEGFEDRIRQFWRISMYVKAGFLYKRDLETICTAMEAFNEKNKTRAALRDPNGDFANLDIIIPKMKALLAAAE